MVSKEEKYNHMGNKIIFIVFFLVYLVAIYFHLRLGKYFDEYLLCIL